VWKMYYMLMHVQRFVVYDIMYEKADEILSFLVLS
jgi:hypothetical protein